MGREGGEGFRMEETRVYLWPILIAVWQNHHNIVIVLQSKENEKRRKKKKVVMGA